MGDKFDYMYDLFTDEFPENQNTKIKSKEELDKLSTDENFSELEKGVHLLVKGYETQKKSIIQNLQRYMTEPGSNKDLVPII